MTDIYLTDCLPDEQVGALAGKLLDESAFGLLVREDTKVYKPNGEPLLIYLKDVLPNEYCKRAWEALRNAATPSQNRGMAAGFEAESAAKNRVSVPANEGSPRRYYLKSDGTLSNTHYAAPVNSGIVGFFDRQARFPYCRMTAFNLDHYPEFQQALPFVKAVDAVFRASAPERYQAQLAMIEKTSPDFYIQGTVFTTITVNKNFAVEARGYTEGWASDELAIRQVFKAIEELGELSRKVEAKELYHSRPLCITAATNASGMARWSFELGRESNLLESLSLNPVGLAEEAADVVIPLLVLCEALGFDLLAEVERKVNADIERGVRANEE